MFEFEIVTIYYTRERVFEFDIVTCKKSFYPNSMLIYECWFERFTRSYLYPYGTDVWSCNRRLLKNEILYNLSSGSETIDTTPPPAIFLRFIYFSVCSHMISFGFFNHIFNDIKID